MAVNPICIYTFVLLDDLTPLTYWRSDWDGSAWSTPPIKVFDSTPTAANFLYAQSAGATADGTHLGITLSHTEPSSLPDATTLTFLGDGIPTAPVDMSNGNTLSIAATDASGSFWFNGAYYTAAYDSTAVRIMTSPTGLTGTWTEVGAANHPRFNVTVGGVELGFVGALRFNIPAKKIDLFSADSTHIFLYSFDLVSLTWTGPYAIHSASGVLFPGTGGAPSVFRDEVIRFPNGDIGVLYFKSAASVTWFYRIFNGTTWGSEIPLPFLTRGDSYRQTIIDPASVEVMNVWISNDPSSHSDSFSYYTLTHQGVITGPIYTTRTIDDSSAGGMGHGISFNGIQYIPITDPDLTTDSVWIGAGASLVETQLPIPPGDQGIGPEVAGYMIDFLSLGPSASIILGLDLSLPSSGASTSTSPVPPPPPPFCEVNPGPGYNPTLVLYPDPTERTGS